MNKKQRAAAIVEELKRSYPEAVCSLDYLKDYELLFATRLAAQCTDARVNLVTPGLFAQYPTLEAFAGAELSELEDAVRPCGFFHIKARDIQAAARVLLDEYGGRVPDTLEALLKIPGVGRKTANLILGDLYGKPAVVVDTHCLRISNRLGLADSQDPYKVELALRGLIPPDEQSDFCHRLVWHGREVCMARKPDCARCTLRAWCAHAK